MVDLEKLLNEIRDEARHFYPDAIARPKDTYEKGDAVVRVVLVSSSFEEDAPWDSRLALEVRERVNQNKLLNKYSEILIAIQPVSKSAYDREDGDIAKITDENYKNGSGESLPLGASSDSTASV